MTLAYAADAVDVSEPRRSSRATAMDVFGLVGFGMVLFALSMGALAFTRFEELTALWPTNAVAFVAIMRSRWSPVTTGRLAAVVAVAVAAPLLLGSVPIWAVLLITLFNVGEVLLAAWLTRRWVGREASVTGLGGLCKLLAAAAIVAPAVAATLITPVFMNIPEDIGGQAGFGQLWFDAWSADALGMMLIAPFGLALDTREASALPLRRRLEGVALALLIAAGVAWIFGHHLFDGQLHAGRDPSGLLTMLLLTPLLILASLRFGVVGAAGAALLTAMIALGFTVAGHGPIADIPGMAPQMKVYWLQLYMAVAGLSTMPVAAVLRERDAYAREIAAHRQRAEKASEGKSRLLANVSHEIKSPVGGIIGIGELWSSGKLGPITPMQEEMSEMLVRTARQIEALAYDLLDVARAESGAVSVVLRPVELASLVEDVKRAAMLKPEAAGLQWTVEAPRETVLALADSVRLSQVLTNLVTNAMKYGRAGGVVVLRVSQPAAGRCRVEVIDRGPGIALDKQKELFEPFNRLGLERTTVEGHGIGLALARRLAELQGGALGFESRPGEGARFWVDLPTA